MSYTLPGILIACIAAAGALPTPARAGEAPAADLFAAWLRQHHPTRADVVLERIASTHGGAANAAPGRRNAGEGPWAQQIAQLFRLHARRHGLDRPHPQLRCDAFRPPGGRQQTIW